MPWKREAVQIASKRRSGLQILSIGIRLEFHTVLGLEMEAVLDSGADTLDSGQSSVEDYLGAQMHALPLPCRISFR